ncbi:SGNH hydrolase-type esterase domain-containing protein [Fennellomyces sp. T-0311]|nr:SGNH hydrolase-type esterase domain-containing protein [Fennellomyces sp. T-0311]
MLRLFFCYVTLFFAILEAYADDTPKNDMIVLGDSYTADLTDLCNGPKWIRELGNTWNNVSIQNFAVGGACCSNQDHMPSPSIVRQTDQYLDTHPNSNPNTTIFSIFVGINDLVAGEAPSDVIGCIESQIMRLNDKVQGKQFMIFNMVPFDRSPRMIEEGKTNNTAIWIQQFNQELGAKVSEILQRYPDFRIVVIDTHSTLNKVLDNPASFGITKNVDDYYMRLVPNPGFHSDGLLSDGNQFFWFDKTHITNIVHEQISKAIVDQQPFPYLPLVDPNAPSTASVVQHRNFALLAFIIGIALLL